MGIPVSLVLIAVGATLGFAVHPHDTGAVDVNTVGWIILAVGVFGLLLTLMFWDSWGGGSLRRHVGPPVAPGRPATAPPVTRRTTVVEDVDDPPPAPPY